MSRLSKLGYLALLKVNLPHPERKMGFKLRQILLTSKNYIINKTIKINVPTPYMKYELFVEAISSHFEETYHQAWIILDITFRQFVLIIFSLFTYQKK